MATMQLSLLTHECNIPLPGPVERRQGRMTEARLLLDREADAAAGDASGASLAQEAAAAAAEAQRWQAAERLLRAQLGEGYGEVREAAAHALADVTGKRERAAGAEEQAQAALRLLRERQHAAAAAG